MAFSKGALDALRSHVAKIGRLAATAVNGDSGTGSCSTLRITATHVQRALAPLVRFHSADQDIFYLYTMVERDGVAYFVLYPASPDLKTDRKLEASDYMERFERPAEYNDDWLEQLAAGKT